MWEDGERKKKSKPPRNGSRKETVAKERKGNRMKSIE